MKKIPAFVTNKYLIAIVFFVAWMLFFDQKDIFSSLERRSELKKLEEKKTYYLSEIEKTNQELTDLQNSSYALEKFARERYQMKKDGEDVFLIEDLTVTKK